jgi:apolipoprotein D and lipocalin family protein
MKSLVLILSSVSVLTAAVPAFAMGRSHESLPTVESVDINRYLGTWYEIARLPQWFEKDCTAVTANYTLRDDGKIRVTNTCRKGTPDGEEKVSIGKAVVADPASNSKLRVSFFWPFFGDYWIIELGTDYDYAVVGSPDRKTLWILSRYPRMDSEQINAILERRKAQGFPVDAMEFTVQP